MIAFGIAVTDEAAFQRFALPGIERAAEQDSLVLRRGGLSIRAAYNAIMDEVAGRSDLEALVLLHQDLELTDDSLPRLVRGLFRDPRVGLAGSLGASNVTLHLPTSRRLHGVLAATGAERRFSSGRQDVEGVDGALMVLAPWVVRGLRLDGLDEAAGDFHGYDIELALRVRAHGGKVVCDELPYFHHHRPRQDFEAQGRARVALARGWDPDLRSAEWAPSFRL